MKPRITVEVFVQAPIEKIWQHWTEPQYIQKWNFASDDWCTPRAENDLRVGGKFKMRMEAKDGSAGFDFEGTYTDIVLHKKISYEMADGRKVDVEFSKQENGYGIQEIFEAEDTHSLEKQKIGWQAILDNFKKSVLGKLL